MFIEHFLNSSTFDLGFKDESNGCWSSIPQSFLIGTQFKLVPLVIQWRFFQAMLDPEWWRREERCQPDGRQCVVSSIKAKFGEKWKAERVAGTPSQWTRREILIEKVHIFLLLLEIELILWETGSCLPPANTHTDARAHAPHGIVWELPITIVYQPGSAKGPRSVGVTSRPDCSPTPPRC